ncbi:MAG: sensor histidine kinase [Candidatus Sumerlaeota bacterium]
MTLINSFSEAGGVLLHGAKDRPLAVVLDEQPPSAGQIKNALQQTGYEVFVGLDFAALSKLSDEQYSRTQILAISTTLPFDGNKIDQPLPEYFMNMFPMTPVLLVGEGFEEFLQDRAASMFILSHLHRPLDKNLLSRAIARCDEYVRLFGSVVERICFMRQAELTQEPIARIIHDLNNQITGLKGGIDLLSYTVERLDESEDKEKIARYLNQFILPGMSAVEEMLGGWRQLREQQLDDPNVANAASVALHGVRMAATPACHQKITFEILSKRESLFEHPEDDILPDIPVQGNPRLLPTAVAHLVRNALEATDDHPQGKVLIQLNRSTEPGTWSLAVYDNGPGIDPDHQSDIWRSFFTTKDGLRTGMGLSLAKQIIDKCNGQISVVPSPLGGTGFEILLASPPIG